MPIYVYSNPETGESVELSMTISEMNRRQDKDKSIVHEGVRLVRSIAGEHRGFRNTPGSWPMKSDAAGVHPSQIREASEEMSRLGVPTRFDSDTGQAIFESRMHRRAFLRAKGMYDRNGGYGD
jgi:hypothetical protein